MARVQFNVPQIQRRERRVPLQEIIAVQGQNPLAGGIDALSAALQKRAELERQAQQVAAISKATGVDLPGVSDPATALSLAKTMADQKADAARQAESLAVRREAMEGTNALRMMVAENLRNERESRREERINKDILAYSESLEKNPVVKDLKKQQIGLDQVDELVGSVMNGNTVAASALGTKMARAMGEVGVLTETDISRYVQSGRLDRKAADTLSRWTRGRPTEATVNEIAQIADVLRDSFGAKIQPIYNTYADRLSVNYGLTPEEAARRLVIPYRKSGNLPALPQTKKATHRWNPQTGKVEEVR